MKGTGEYTFTGTRGLNDPSRFKEFIKANYGLEIEDEPINSRGINWGKVFFDTDMKTSTPDACLRFEIDNRLAFEVPYEQITRCANPGTNRNTLTLDFVGPKGKGGAQALESITFAVTGKASVASGLKQKISSKTKTGANTEKLCAQFESLKFMTPRGRFTVEFYEKFALFQGASQDYRVFYKEIEKLIYVAASSETMYLVISKGISTSSNTSSGSGGGSSMVNSSKAQDFVLSLENRLDEVELNKVILDQTWQEKPKIASCEKTQAELLSNLFADLTGRNLALSDESYKSSEAKTFARCTCKGRGNEPGSLYPLKAGIIFLHKPVIYIRYQDISYVRFSEISGMSSGRANINSTFELTFVMKSRDEDHFTGIYLSELDGFYNLFYTKKIVMRNADDVIIKSKLDIGSQSSRSHDRKAQVNYADDDDDEEDDDDFDDDGEEDEEDEDFDAVNDDGEDAVKTKKKDDDEDEDEEEEEEDEKPKEHKRHHSSHHKKSEEEGKKESKKEGKKEVKKETDDEQPPPQKKVKSEETSN